MTREAATLGVPAITAFPGTLGAVDRFLVQSGRLQILQAIEDLHSIRIEKRPEALLPAPNPQLFQTIFEQIIKQALR